MGDGAITSKKKGRSTGGGKIVRKGRRPQKDQSINVVGPWVPSERGESLAVDPVKESSLGGGGKKKEGRLLRGKGG